MLLSFANFVLKSDPSSRSLKHTLRSLELRFVDFRMSREDDRLEYIDFSSSALRSYLWISFTMHSSEDNLSCSSGFSGSVCFDSVCFSTVCFCSVCFTELSCSFL